jgi:nitroimidazol reductase NimA-like FMN-containing flavoprotein (pyridoxamine 5'-phosphate oxidase superfamily)
MRVIPISQEECEGLLSRVSIGRLGCALDNQPYVVPVSFAYEPKGIHVFSTLGQKIKWMRQNPKVCLQVDEMGNRSNWTSVVVNGTYLELKEPQYTAEKERARERLAQSANWWLTAMAERREQVGDLKIAPVFFRIEIESITGLRGEPESD